MSHPRTGLYRVALAALVALWAGGASAAGDKPYVGTAVNPEAGTVESSPRGYVGTAVHSDPDNPPPPARPPRSDDSNRHQSKPAPPQARDERRHDDRNAARPGWQDKRRDETRPRGDDRRDRGQARRDDDDRRDRWQARREEERRDRWQAERVADQHREWRHDRRDDHRRWRDHRRPTVGVVVPVLPYGYSEIRHYRGSYFYASGLWYQPWGSGYISIGAPIGIGISTLPPGYSTVVVGSGTYYRYGDDWYRPYEDHYVVVERPRDAAADDADDGVEDELFAYPREGQNEQKQAEDRYQCHRWAVDQTGYDPSLVSPAGASRADMARRPDYVRALTACLEGRGYTVR